MPFTPEQQRASLASQTRLTKLQTLKFEHPQIDTLRLVSDVQDLQGGEGVYNRFDFEVIPPEKSTEGTPQLEISVGIVDYRVMLALRSLKGIRGQIEITYTEVQADDPDQVIAAPSVFYFEDMTTNSATAAKIRASFLPGALDDAYPYGRIGPANAGA